MKDEQMGKGQSMEKLYEPWSRVSVLEDAQSEGPRLESILGGFLSRDRKYYVRRLKVDVS